MSSTLDPDTSRRLSIGMAFLAGVLAGAVLLTAYPGLLGGDTAREMGPDPDDPPYSVSKGGPSCYEGETNPNAGWVHEVAVGTSYAVTLNATVVHDAGTEVEASVIRRGETAYELALRTTESVEEEPSGCDPVRTTLGMGVSLPTSYERLVVTVNGETLVDAERDDTTADLYPLPNPLNVTS